jgi:hypothetical protein
VLEALPKSVHGRVKKAVREKTEAENKAEAKEVLKGFEDKVRREVAEGRSEGH